MYFDVLNCIVFVFYIFSAHDISTILFNYLKFLFEGLIIIIITIIIIINFIFT